jgi:hypothetical protein
MSFSKLVRTAALSLTTLAFVAVSFVGCSDMVTQPDSPSIEMLAWQNQTLHDDTPDILAGIDIDGAWEQGIIDDGFSKPAGRRKLRALNYAVMVDDTVTMMVGKNWLIKKALVVAGEETVIEFGTDKVGYSNITFPAGAVEEDVLVTIVHKLKGKRDIFFFPDMAFGEEVTLRFSLHELNERQIRKLTNLRLWYHNTALGGWEYVSSYSDGDWVIATLDHFSRYAVGSDE